MKFIYFVAIFTILISFLDIPVHEEYVTNSSLHYLVSIFEVICVGILSAKLMRYIK